MQEKINYRIKNLEKMIVNLEHAVRAEKDQSGFVIDASIKRFQLSFDLFNRALKVILEHKGLNPQFPRDVLQAAYQNQLISDEKTFLEMLKDRNETSHTYDQSIADEIYDHIKHKYAPLLKKETNNIKKLFYKI